MQTNTTLQDKIKEVMPKEIIPVEIPHHNPYLTGYNTAISDCISSLPKILEVVRGEVEKLPTHPAGYAQERMIKPSDIIKLLSFQKNCCENYNGTLDITGSCIFCKTFITNKEK